MFVVQDFWLNKKEASIKILPLSLLKELDICQEEVYVEVILLKLHYCYLESKPF